MALIKWPVGPSILAFDYQLTLVQSLLLTGKVLAIDPGSNNLGWALFDGGVLVESGSYAVSEASIATRMQDLDKRMRMFPPVDVLLIEHVQGPQVHNHLNYSVGVIMASVLHRHCLQVPIPLWKAFVKSDRKYRKSDEADAKAIGEATIAYCQREMLDEAV